MGSNGCGKSTLLRFIAAKPCRLPVAADLDILLVEQETSASETSVVEQVLAADTARAALLAEEAALWTAISSSSSVGDEEGGNGDGTGAGHAETTDTTAAAGATRDVAADATAQWTAEDWTKNLERHVQPTTLPLSPRKQQGGVVLC